MLFSLHLSLYPLILTLQIIKKKTNPCKKHKPKTPNKSITLSFFVFMIIIDFAVTPYAFTTRIWVGLFELPVNQIKMVNQGK
jgi:hypothetical protein